MNQPSKARILQLAAGFCFTVFFCFTSLTPNMVWGSTDSEAETSQGLARNPVIFADFSDPDVVERNGFYYMVASSFNHQPGVPVLRSSDLVNWQRIAYVMKNHPQADYFSSPRHGQGMWAPCIRFHNGKFWVFMPDPDFGIYVSTATQPQGPWSEPHLLLPGKGIIDPTPMWITDPDTGEEKAYLLHAWAKSRAGFNNLLTLRSMTPDAKTILDDGKVVVDGNQLPGFRTLEGPKFYQRGEYFYIFAPAGGVEEGWQTVFRAKDIEGPYETRVTLEQGTTNINGPHQGAWVTGPKGQDWFIHFQDRNAYGRIVHMQPMAWENDWPVMGKDIDGNGVGEPVNTLAIGAAQQPLAGLTTSDTFDGETLGAQWQWNANWKPGWYRLSEGKLSLYAQPARSNLWHQPAILSQMVYGPSMSVETRLNWQNMAQGDEAGLVVYGYDYAWLGIEKLNHTQRLIYRTCVDTLNQCQEQTLFEDKNLLTNKDNASSAVGLAVDLKVTIEETGPRQATAQFSYKLLQSQYWSAIEQQFTLRPGRWVGARVGLFSQNKTNGNGHIKVEHFAVKLN